MKVVLSDIAKPLVDMWRTYFDGYPGVTITWGSIFDVDCDALVSPANSFGFMDGGLDLLISKAFGWHVQERLQEIIRNKHHGELLVGAAEIVPSNNRKMPWVICAPTMRVPMPVLGTINAYLATRAVFLLVGHGTLPDGRAVREVVKTVALPGMGTGAGRLSPEICAAQMKAAYDDVVMGPAVFPSSWLEAQTKHTGLCGDNAWP